MNKIYLLIAILSFASCQNKANKNEIEVNTDSVITDIKVAEISESDLAKKWLIESIEKNFKTSEGLIDSICTKEYATYKSDAIGVEYDGGMTKQAFEKKWKDKFDVKHVGIGTGFLISGQDWEDIKVAKCELSPLKLKSGYLFEVLIEDLPFKYAYKRDIKVIKSGKSFLISDVLE
jgi:hypothetical protein